MGDEWLNEAIKSATGNIPVYTQFQEECFSIFEKYAASGYPDMVIVSLLSDATKMPMTIPMMFDMWRSEK